MYHDRHIAVVIPAHNEARAIGHVLSDVAALESPIDGTLLIDDLVVCNNASTDDTGEVAREIADQLGWRVVDEAQPGYGAACQRALTALDEGAGSDLVVFIDGDCSVNVQELPELLAPILDGAELVIGNRVPHRRGHRAMTLPQVAGNGLATLLIRLLWRRDVSDLGPFRVITRDALRRIDMQDRRFGWTVEMQVRALQLGMNVQEVPVTTVARVGKSKISGTLRGVTLAGKDILTTIFKLYISEKRKVTMSTKRIWERSR